MLSKGNRRITPRSGWAACTPYAGNANKPPRRWTSRTTLSALAADQRASMTGSKQIPWHGPKSDPADILRFIRECIPGMTEPGEVLAYMDPADFSLDLKFRSKTYANTLLRSGEVLIYLPERGQFFTGMDLAKKGYKSKMSSMTEEEARRELDGDWPPPERD